MGKVHYREVGKLVELLQKKKQEPTHFFLYKTIFVQN